MPHPQLSDAKGLAKKHNLKVCVILFQIEDGSVGYASYGEDRALCRSTQVIMDSLFDQIEYRFVAAL